MANDWVSIFSPATVGNIGAGFDILGMALENPGDVVRGRLSKNPGVTIKDIIDDNGLLPRDPALNTASISAQAVLDQVGSAPGLEIIIEKHMPIACGLGSSSASAAGGAFLANELTGKKLSTNQLIAIAGDAEYHVTHNYGEQCIAALLGGIVVTTSFRPLAGYRVGCPVDVWVTLVYPHFHLETKHARAVLPKEVPFSSAVKNSQQTARMIVGAVLNDTTLFCSGVEDSIVEPARQQLIPGFASVKEAALTAGALASSISGAGPTVFALAREKTQAESIGAAMKKAFAVAGQESTVFVSQVATKGAQVLMHQE